MTLLEKICHFRINMPFLEKCVVFGYMCSFWIKVPFSDKYAVFGYKCSFWKNVQCLDKCTVFKTLEEDLKCISCRLLGLQ